MKVYWGVEVQLYSIRKLLDTASCNVTVEVKPHAFLPSAFDVGEWSASRSDRPNSDESPPPHFSHYIGWFLARAQSQLDAVV
jgi:hypothetical protein